MAGLDELVALLQQAEHSDAPARATSLRLPADVHRAVTKAIDLGMDESFTAATSRALVEAMWHFVRRRAIADHLSAFPADEPSLEEVVRRRVSGTDHIAAHRPELIADVAAFVEHRHPDWARSGRIDETVDRVLEDVELIAARQGRRRSAHA